MATLDVAITSASGETDFVRTGAEGRGFAAVTGTVTTGAILVVVKMNGGATEYVTDTIDATTIQQNSNEAGTGYSYCEEIAIPSNASFALKANAAFTGSVTASAWAEPY